MTTYAPLILGVEEPTVLPSAPPDINSALLNSHVSAGRLEVWSAGQLITTIGEGSVDYPYLLSGSVTIAYDQPIRRQCSLVVTDPTGELVPSTILDLLAPFGTEIRPFRGVQFSDEIAYYPLGVFGLTTTTIHDGGDGLYVTLTGDDRARNIQANAWTDAYQIAAGTNIGSAIQGVVSDRLPGTQFSFTPTGALTPPLILGEQAGNDPWQDAQNMATAIGMQLFFDPFGVCTMAAVPDLSTTLLVSSWDLKDDATSIFSVVDRAFTNADTYSGVLVTVGTTGNTVPYRALVWDDDPASATYYLGPFGPRPYVYQSTTITSEDQAISTAVGLLNLKRGAVETVTLTVVPNPSIDVNDVITLERARSKIPPATAYIVSSITMPLEAQTAMTLVARRTV